MKRVYVASPFRGATTEETRQNIVYARLCILDSLERGEAPYLSHLLYTQVWSEDSREAGLLAGEAWRHVAGVVALYTDLGMTPGMQRARNWAERRMESVVLEERRVHWYAVDAAGPLETPSAWRRELHLLSLKVFPELDREAYP